MIPTILLKKIRLSTLPNLADAITALVTAAIVSMDLGVPFNETELSVYGHPLVQSIVVFSICYEVVSNVYLSTILLATWLLLKYAKLLNLSKEDVKKDS